MSTPGDKDRPRSRLFGRPTGLVVPLAPVGGAVPVAPPAPLPAPDPAPEPAPAPAPEPPPAPAPPVVSPAPEPPPAPEPAPPEPPPAPEPAPEPDPADEATLAPPPPPPAPDEDDDATLAPLPPPPAPDEDDDATLAPLPPAPEGDPIDPVTPVAFAGSDEPTLLRPLPPAPAAPPDAPPEDEPTLNEWSLPTGLATPADVPEPAELAEPGPADAAAAEPADLDPALEPVPHEDDPELRPVVPVRRNLAIGRFGGANPAGLLAVGQAPAPAPAPVTAATAAPEADRGPSVVMASAPGKIILLGEHAVVYGHRAIAAAVDLCTTVTIRRRPGPTAIEDTLIEDPRLNEAIRTIVPGDGFGVSIRSTLPVGCGMGSSAALAVATVRAVARLEGREASLKECIDRGYALERVFHGTPSGLDHTVSASGRALVYRRGEPAEELRVGRPLRLVIANTGVPANTAEMVDRVRRRNPVEQLTRIGALVEMAAVRIARGEPVGEFVREAHRCLRLMGVSTPRLDDLCRAMESAGASGAKLAGAGGGGVAIALVDERHEDAVRRAAESLAPGGVFLTTIAASPQEG